METVHQHQMAKTLNSFPFQNTRLKTATVDFIVEMASFHEVHQIQTVPHQCVVPFKPSMQAKMAITRVEIVEKLVQTLRLEKNRSVSHRVVPFKPLHANIDGYYNGRNSRITCTESQIREKQVRFQLTCVLFVNLDQLSKDGWYLRTE